ncbi:MAG: glycosyltransferase family 2 protein [Leptospiraceae bacterium]|nr:glycosyltransferase family 2 protein [Leptospiraceae bacterium]MCP5511140.1 glycosyltransferase family 2 protein [Leptospiraceae bacterium]
MSKNLAIIPAYNEEETIEEVVRHSIQHSEVCVVNDASKDRTPEILAALKKEFPDTLHIIHHEKNTHIPGGVQDGMKFALQGEYDYVVTMDAGMSHDPNALPQFFNAEHCDLLIGKREKVEGVPLYRRMISYLAARVMNYCISEGIFDLFGPGIADCTSGFRRYSKKAYSFIANQKLESIAFDFHMEALALTYRNGGSVREIGIHYKFSNSSFNKKVLKLAIDFALKLLKRKWGMGRTSN